MSEDKEDVLTERQDDMLALALLFILGLATGETIMWLQMPSEPCQRTHEIPVRVEPSGPEPAYGYQRGPR